MRIAVGFLQSHEGRAALDAAIVEAERRQASLLIVHSMRGGEADEADTIATHDRALRAITANLDERGIDHEVRRFARGASPAEDLLDAADEFDVDLLVIGVRRRSPVGKLLLGSNTQDIVLRANCPVLAVKPGQD